MDLNQRVNLLETRLKRQHEHLLAVIAGQRGRVEQAFDEVKLAMLEQELATKVFRERTEKAFFEVGEALKTQESATQEHIAEVHEAL